MSLAFLIYIADVLGNIDGVAWFVFFTAGIIAVLMKIIHFIAEEERGIIGKSHTKSLLIAMAIGAVIGTFVPDKTTIYMMVGAQLVEDVAATPEAARISDRLLTLIEVKLDEAIEASGQETTTSEEE